jgi:hypothetical protein
MVRIRLMLLALTMGAFAFAGWTSPAGAGQGPPVLEGVVTCANGQYTIAWTVTIAGLPQGAESNLEDIELSGATTGTVVFTPNPVPGPSPAVAHGTTVLPGTTVGDVTLTLVSDYIVPQEATDTVTLEGTCVVTPEPEPAPVNLAPNLAG